ncbi:MAG TPA: glycosyltransferase family 2 protein [Opitutaceae bacterium]|nr:glycosyltransferase family 2 protein [Opitutaceae bacterium]
MEPSSSHLLLIPSYNTGPRLAGVIAEALRHWRPVLVVIDGSTDGSEQPLLALARQQNGLTVLVRPHNAGKGAAVLAGLAWARDRGFTHALAMDADGQHPAALIGEFMEISRTQPDAMVLGRPIFGPEVPVERLYGRKLSVGLVHVATLGRDIADPLYGFRVYPVQPLLAVLGPRRGGRRYDFDTEAAVRLLWAGVRPINRPAPVRYFTRAEGGVSHFHYLRDNLTLAWMHTRLVGEMLFRRWPAILRHHRRWQASGVPAGEAAAEMAR